MAIEFEDDRTAEAIDFLTTYKKFVTKEYGKRCKSKACGCINCQMWALYDLTCLMIT
jgi:hypothetical protein